MESQEPSNETTPSSTPLTSTGPDLPTSNTSNEAIEGNLPPQNGPTGNTSNATSNETPAALNSGPAGNSEHTIPFTPFRDMPDDSPLSPPPPPITQSPRGRRLWPVLGVVALVLLLSAALGAAIYQQTQWGQHLYAALRHARATATMQSGKDNRQFTLVAARATTQSSRDAQHATDIGATATSMTSAYHRLRSEATSITGQDMATATAQQGIIDQMPPSPTNTPDAPYLQTCLQEDIDQSEASCTREVDSFYVNGVSDDAIAFVVPDPSGYNFTSLQWRLFKFDNNGGSTSEGSYTDSSGDPQNPGVWWSLESLFSHFSSYQYGVDTGTYKMEVLDHDGQVLASTVFTIRDSPFAQSSGDTPTPDTSSSLFDLPTDTPGPTY